MYAEAFKDNFTIKYIFSLFLCYTLTDHIQSRADTGGSPGLVESLMH